MNKTIVSILIIAVIAAALYALIARDDSSSSNMTKVEGRVVNMDLEQITFDGPYIVVIEDEGGADYVIHVPSMGLGLCAARENITNPSELSVGDRIEVAGMLTPDGILVPCESPEHYLRENN